jgi:hypothetical protein
MAQRGRPAKALAEHLLDGTLRADDPRHRELLRRSERPPTVPIDVWSRARARFGLDFNPMDAIPMERS